MRTCDDAMADGITMQLVIRRDVATDVQVVQRCNGGQCDGRFDDAFDGRGCTPEFPATKSKKLVKVPRTQEKKKKKLRTNPSHAPPSNRRFPISTHRAEIEGQVDITRQKCRVLPALAT